MKRRVFLIALFLILFLLTARMAEGKFHKWEQVLFKIAESLQVNR
jgi:hypothetical protein